jgi:hypothetical protein
VTHDCNHYVKRYDPHFDASKKNRAPPKDLWKISVNKRYGKNSRTYGKEKIPSPIVGIPKLVLLVVVNVP